MQSKVIKIKGGRILLLTVYTFEQFFYLNRPQKQTNLEITSRYKTLERKKINLYKRSA